MEGFTKVESPGVDELLQSLHQQTGQPIGKFIARRCGSMGRYFAESTYPLAGNDGFSLKAKQVGQAAVKRDIARVYISPSSTYKDIQARHGQKLAKAFIGHLKAGRYQDAKDLLERLGLRGAVIDIISWDAGYLHKNKRNRRGRINSGTKPVLVADPQALKRYILEMVKRVGFAKSGWITAARQIPGAQGFAELPAWMKQPAPGSGVDKTKSREDPHAVLMNLVSYLEGLVPPRAISLASASFEESLKKELSIVLEKVAQKHAAVLQGA